MLQEDGNLAILLEEADNRLVESREMVVTLVLARVVDGTAIEDESATVAGWVVRDAFLIGEADDLHLERASLQVVGELFQLSQFP